MVPFIESTRKHNAKKNNNTGKRDGGEFEDSSRPSQTQFLSKF